MVLFCMVSGWPDCTEGTLDVITHYQVNRMNRCSCCSQCGIQRVFSHDSVIIKVSDAVIRCPVEQTVNIFRVTASLTLMMNYHD